MDKPPRLVFEKDSLQEETLPGSPLPEEYSHLTFSPENEDSIAGKAIAWMQEQGLRPGNPEEVKYMAMDKRKSSLAHSLSIKSANSPGINAAKKRPARLQTLKL